MQERTQSRSRTSRSQWVPSDVGPAPAPPAPPRRRPAKKGDTDEWLPVPKPADRNGGASENGTRSRKRPRLPKRASPRERWLITRLRRSKRRVDEQRDEIERLQRRVSELEAASRAQPPSGNGNGHGDRLDLNQASFEDLRNLGLSVTQSARLIAHRDASRPFTSVDEVEELPGFGKATLELLRSRARANGF